MQENGKKQDEVECNSGRPMFHLGTKRTKRERDNREGNLEMHTINRKHHRKCLVHFLFAALTRSFYDHDS